MNEAPRELDPVEVEVEDPTQPFSRERIDALRRAAVQRLAATERPDPNLDRTLEDPDDPSSDEEWVETPDRWIRVSLAAFADLCLGRKPENMLSSTDASLVHGQIGWDPLRDWDGAMEWSVRRTRRRRWLLTLLGVPVIVGLAIWGGLRREPPTDSEIAVPNEAIRVAPVPVRPEDESLDGWSQSPPDPTPGDGPSPRSAVKKKSEAGEDCAVRRRQIDDAEQQGDWPRLEELARRTSCLSRPEAMDHRMHALFELERFEECISLGQKSKSKEIQQWVTNCQLGAQRSSSAPSRR